ncbi:MULTISPECIES: redox-sensing transcriptional repressor Rex [unclassified Verrucomicrobium]|uniref:redox-sensing transcriptional repressor Rex n=1 Tax=unclassified Verrucomicrobium TaxID=2625155 RepID=UPI000571ACE5|nr:MULTISPECIES: redox-sensing transcriptional repressor Rex [unclassified Verrucomicrobium]
MTRIEIPRKTVYRLSIYQRCLQRLKDNMMETVSSEALAKAAGVKSTQLRKDLTYFGQFGTRGLGYNVAGLSGAIGEVLGRSRLQPVILVGVGNLGAALLRYGGFQKEGFEIVSAFDVRPDPKRMKGLKIPLMDAKELSSFIRENHIKMAILTVPATHGQEVVNEMVEAGIQAILNFSPVVLDVPKNVVVNNVDLAVELENLSYFIR